MIRLSRLIRWYPIASVCCDPEITDDTQAASPE